MIASSSCSKKVSSGESQARETQIKLKANAKLIAALEQEEQRLLDNERKYANEVKDLQAQLEHLQQMIQNLQSEKDVLESKVRILSINTLTHSMVNHKK